MPKLRKNETEQIKDTLLMLIRANMGLRDMTVKELARVLNVCESTVYNRMENPGTFTLEQLITVCKKLHIRMRLESEVPDCVIGQ